MDKDSKTQKCAVAISPLSLQQPLHYSTLPNNNTSPLTINLNYHPPLHRHNSLLYFFGSGSSLLSQSSPASYPRPPTKSTTSEVLLGHSWTMTYAVHLSSPSYLTSRIRIPNQPQTDLNLYLNLNPKGCEDKPKGPSPTSFSTIC